MNTYNENEHIDEENLDAASFLGGNYLGKDDLAPGEDTTARIIAVRAETMPNSNRKKLVAEFAEIHKPLILNKTNIKRLSKIFSSTHTSEWRGVVTLYVDEAVEYGGKPVGGIRIKRASKNGAAAAAVKARRINDEEADLF